MELDDRPTASPISRTLGGYPAADLDVDELQDLLLTGGERCCFSHAGEGNTITRSWQTPVRNFFP